MPPPKATSTETFDGEIAPIITTKAYDPLLVATGSEPLRDRLTTHPARTGGYGLEPLRDRLTRSTAPTMTSTSAANARMPSGPPPPEPESATDARRAVAWSVGSSLLAARRAAFVVPAAPVALAPVAASFAAFAAFAPPAPPVTGRVPPLVAAALTAPGVPGVPVAGGGVPGLVTGLPGGFAWVGGRGGGRR